MPDAFPLNVSVTPVDKVANWRPLVNWLLIIPHYLWLMVQGLGAYVLVILSWFSIVFTGRAPENWGAYIVGVLRYGWRVMSFLYAFNEEYPGFELLSGYNDPGGYPAALSSVPDAGERNRLTVFFRALMVIPQMVVIYFVGIAAGVVLLLAWFAVLFTGRWPEGMRTFCINYYRWYLRVIAYYFLVTDVYPPFGLEVA